MIGSRVDGDWKLPFVIVSPIVVMPLCSRSVLSGGMVKGGALGLGEVSFVV